MPELFSSGSVSRLRWESLRSLSSLLAPAPVDLTHQAERVRFMERDVGLPVRVVVLAALFYYLFLSDWFDGLNTIGQVALETVRRAFQVYVGVNLAAAGIYIFMDRLPFRWVRWVVFVVNFVDGLFIGVVTLVTGGLESLAYWVFLGLIARNALTFPVASLQISLNLLLIASYLYAGFMDRAFTRFELSAVESLAQLAAPVGELASRRETSPAAGTNVAAAFTGALTFYTNTYTQLAETMDRYREIAAHVAGSPTVSTNVAVEFVQAFGKCTWQFARYTNAFERYTNAYARSTNSALWPDGKAWRHPDADQQFDQVRAQFSATAIHYASAYVQYNNLVRRLPTPLRGKPRLDLSLVPPPTRSTFGVSESEYSTQYLLLRILLMLLMAACAYGMQALVDKQHLALEEAQEFQARQKQLETAGRLAAQIAHQVKNPLAIINSAAYCLQRNTSAGQEAANQQIRIIREEVGRADQIITKLMGYSQLAEGRVEKLSLAEEVDRAIAQVFRPGAIPEVQVEQSLTPDLPPLLMKRAHLSEILVNLLLNAREAVRGHGRVKLSAQPTADGAVEIRVSDTGPGIPPDRFEQVFEPYFSTKARGTGLGLAIVKQNTEMYAGTVRVESVLGKGATVVLHFPTRTFMTEEA